MRAVLLGALIALGLVLAAPGYASPQPLGVGGYGVLGTPPDPWRPEPDPGNFGGPGPQHHVDPNQTIGPLAFTMEDYDTHQYPPPEYQDPDCFWLWSTYSISNGGTVSIQWALGWQCRFSYTAPDYEGDWECTVVLRAEDNTMRNNGRDDDEFFQVQIFSW